MTPHVAIPALLALALPLLLADRALARPDECPPSPLTGTWHNPDASIQELLRIELVEDCSDAAPGLLTWQIYAWSRCAPRPCRWGVAPAVSKDPSVVVVRFDTFAARRFLKISTAGHAVHVKYLIDYRTESRQDERGEMMLTPAD